MDHSSNAPQEYAPVEWDRLILTEQQAADFLSMARSTLRSKASRGKIPRYSRGGQYRYYAYDLLDYGTTNKLVAPLQKQTAPAVTVVEARTKRPGGSGSVYQRKDGRWVAEYREKDALGRTKTRWLYARTKVGARERLDLVLSPEKRGIELPEPLPDEEPFGASNPHVYGIQCDTGGPVKIGVSVDVSMRLNAIQLCCPFPLRIVALVEHGGMSVERQLHQALARWRTHGEWFVDTADVRQQVGEFVPLAGGHSFSSFVGNPCQ